MRAAFGAAGRTPDFDEGGLFDRGRGRRFGHLLHLPSLGAVGADRGRHFGRRGFGGRGFERRLAGLRHEFGIRQQRDG